MPRPPLCRHVAQEPGVTYFKPRGVPITNLEQVVLSVDELEALRLADKEGMYQDQAAERMKISRPTFGRVVETARRKVAEALVEGKALRIEGGNFEMADLRSFQCTECGHTWQVVFGAGRPAGCPNCRSRNIHRAAKGRGWARGSAWGRGAGPGRGMHEGRGRHGRGPRANPQGGNA